MRNVMNWLFLCLFLVLVGACSSSGGGDDNPDDDTNEDSNTDTGNNDGTGTDNDGDNTDSGDNTDPGTEGGTTFSKMGFVMLAYSAEEDGVGALAGFSEYSTPESIPAEFANGGAFPEELKDTCEVSAFNEDDDDLPDIIETDPSNEESMISAGTPITVTSGGNDYISLDLTEFQGNQFYFPVEVSGTMAQDLRLNIPGDRFPAFNLPMATAEPMVVLQPTSGGFVRFDTTFTWEAGSNPDSVVFIDANNFDTEISCIVRDDGEFSFTQEAQNEVGTGFIASDFSLTRAIMRINIKDGAVLMTATGSGQ